MSQTKFLTKNDDIYIEALKDVRNGKRVKDRGCENIATSIFLEEKRIVRSIGYRAVYKLSSIKLFNKAADALGNKLQQMGISYALGATRAAATIQCSLRQIEVDAALRTLAGLKKGNEHAPAPYISPWAILTNDEPHGDDLSDSGRNPMLSRPSTKDEGGPANYEDGAKPLALLSEKTDLQLPEEPDEGSFFIRYSKKQKIPQ